MKLDEIKRLVAPDNQNPGSMKFQLSVKEIQEVTSCAQSDGHAP
jgi:hypothetical protein